MALEEKFFILELGVRKENKHAKACEVLKATLSSYKHYVFKLQRAAGGCLGIIRRRRTC